MQQWGAKESQGWEALPHSQVCKRPVMGEIPPSFLAASLCSQELLSDKGTLEWAVPFQASLALSTWSFCKQQQPRGSNINHIPLASTPHPNLFCLK